MKSNDQLQGTDLMTVRASYPMDPDAGQATIRRYETELSESANRVFLVGFDGDHGPIAYVQLILKNADNEPDLANGQDVAHVHDLRVKGDLQGQRFGKELMSLLEREARSRGIRTLTLDVDNWNHRAVKFYDMLGYSKFKEVPGRTDDEICFFMRKQI